jgi:6-phosphogluconolactonase
MKFCRIVGTLFVLASLSNFAVPAQGSGAAPDHAKHRTADRRFFLYIGSFTGAAPNGHPDGSAPSKGIYAARFDAGTGDLGAPMLAAELTNPSFLAVSANHRFLYAISESDPEAFVTAYATDLHTGRLRMINKLPTGGAGTAFLSLDKTSKFVLLANYGSGSISVIRIEADGSLGKLTSFVQHSAPRGPRGARGSPPTIPVIPHPHAIVASPDNRFVIVPDLGLNRIFIYRFDAATGILGLPAKAVDLAPDEGPRHFVFSPDGKFGYLISQTSGNVNVFSWDPAEGTLTQVQAAPSLAKGLDANNMSAEIGITPNGKFLYESNRRTHGVSREPGPDSIAVYDIDRQTGALTEVQDLDQGGSIPRCFSIDPTGGFLVVGAQQNNLVEVYRIDSQDGKLFNTGKSIPVHTPACMQFIPVL